MSDRFNMEIDILENKITSLGQFKEIAQALTDKIESLEKSANHIKFERSADSLPFSPKIYLDSISVRERNLLFYCGKGIDLKEAILLAYERKNLRPENLIKKLSEKACTDIDNFEQLAITCYQFMLNNPILYNINLAE